jgi:hypothetical protein
VFLNPMKAEKIASQDTINAIFGDKFESLIEIHDMILASLKGLRKDGLALPGIGKIFLTKVFFLFLFLFIFLYLFIFFYFYKFYFIFYFYLFIKIK